MIRKTLPLVFIAMLAVSACESSEQRAERHFDSGVALLAAGEVSQAQLEFRNVLRLQDDHVEARTLLARTLRERGDTGSAYREYTRLVELHPDILEGRLALAEIAFEAGNWEEVTRHGTAAQDLAPDEPLVTLIGAALAYRDAVLADDAAAMEEAATRARAYLREADDANLVAWRIVVDHATTLTSSPGGSSSITRRAASARPPCPISTPRSRRARTSTSSTACACRCSSRSRRCSGVAASAAISTRPVRL
jgi:cellulose synthase operon protein C